MRPPGANDYIAALGPDRVLPNRCSIRDAGRQCPSPPQFVVSIVAGDGEYMVGVACGRHSDAVAARARSAQAARAAPPGMVRLSPVRPVGTDCIRGSCDGDGLVVPAPAGAGRAGPPAA